MSHRFEASDQSLMVAVNAEIDRLHRSLGLADSEFFCECGDIACKERVALGRLEFSELRRQSRAVLAPWHRHRDLAPGAEVIQLRSNVIQLERAIAERGEMTVEDRS